MSKACPSSAERVEESPINQEENWRTESGRTETFQAFMESLNETSVRKAKVKFGKEWGEEK